MADTDRRRVLVTGASKGIGRAVASAFAQPGTRVALLGRASPQLEETGRRCQERGAEVVLLDADVRDEAGVALGCEQLGRLWGGVDVLVNNAGVGRYAPFLDLSPGEWEEMMRVNLLGAVTLTRCVLPGMLAQGSGHVVNIGSIRGFETIPGTTAYAASKFALAGFSQALRQELEGSGVLVSVVSPGGVRTHFGGTRPEDKNPGFLDPEAVARVVLTMVELGRESWIRDLTVMPLP